MPVQSNSDHSRRQSRNDREKRRPARQIVAASIVVVLLAGIVVYTLKFGPDPPIQPIERTDVALESATSEPVDRSPLNEFIGSTKCAECHSDIAESYSEHPMAITLASVADASRIEVVDGDSAAFEAQGCRYRVERRGDRMIHTEYMNDATGNLVYEQPVDVQYAVGSGVNARTYLIDRGGILFESPITWYTDEKKWDLSPGYQDNPRQRFNRRVTDDCIQCHSGLAAPVGDGTSSRFEKQPFLELGIGCERCHGPGKRHVEKFEADDRADDDVDETAEDLLIVNPARLERRNGDSVCYQCHMEGESRILRQGKSFHDFRPGMSTEDIWTVFVSPTPFEADGTARFTSHVEQMRSSACFLGSEGSMSCTTCHDPHRSPKPDERAAFYRTRCISCHADHGCSLPIAERESPPALDSCIHCHMPMIGSSNIPHTSLSDHRVLKKPRADSPDTADDSQEHAVWSIFDDSDQRMPQWEVQRTRALALSDQAMEESNPRLLGQAIPALEAVLARDAKDVSVLIKLGFLYGATRNHAKAMSSFEAVLQIDPHHEMSLKNLGLIALRSGSTRLGRHSYESYLEVNKWDGTMYGPYAAILANSGDLRAAVEAAERGLQLDPTQRELRSLAAQLWARIGDQNKSQQHREILREISNQLDPWDQKRRDRNRNEMQETLQQSP